MVFKGKDAITKVLGRASTQMREVRRELFIPLLNLWRCHVFARKGMCKHEAEQSVPGGDGLV